MLDTRSALPTPEGVDLTLDLAGPVPRATAFAIDLLIRCAVYAVLAAALSGLGKVGLGLLLISLFIIEWLYPVLFEVLGRGATPGKRSVGLQVVEADGRQVGWSASLIRNLLRTADFLPFCFGFGILFMLFHPRFQRLGDLAAGTVVVWQHRNESSGNSSEERPIEPPLKLRLPEQKALIAFADRAPRLSEARQEELAGILAPLSRDNGKPTVKRLLGMASYLSGAR